MKKKGLLIFIMICNLLWAGKRFWCKNINMRSIPWDNYLIKQLFPEFHL